MNKRRIKIYQLPLISRITLLLSATMLTLFPLIALFCDFSGKWKIVILLVAMIIFTIYAYMVVFKLYICLGLAKNKLIISEFPGTKKE